jgi:DNA-binding CsgD family transcriptional regulator
MRHGTIGTHGRRPGAPLSYGAPPAFDGERETAGFLDELYAAAVEQSRLSTALSQLAIAFDADEACLFTADSSASRDQVTIVERATRAGAPVSPFENRTSSGPLLAQALAAGLAHGGSDVWLGTFGETPTDGRAHLLRVPPLHYLAIASRSDGDPAAGVVALRHSPFTLADLACARTLLPDIRRALNLRRHAGRAEALSLGVQLFDRNPVAIFITRNRAIERSNAAALTLLAAGHPVKVVSGKLHFDDMRVNAAFDLASRAESHANENRAFAFIVEGPDDSTWIAQISPVRPPSHHVGQSGTSSPGITVALTPFNAASQTRMTMLNGFTDLTATERTIFAAFVDGQDIAAIAARQSRSVETVRWHVRNLFAKLGVNSQADLARLGALLLPI